MAILISNDGDKVVTNIAARDLITARFPGMNVTVTDSIADIRTGGGEAGYQWNSRTSQWMLIWKTSKDNLNFITENKVITNGSVQSTYFPSSGLVWDCVAMNPTTGEILADFMAPTVTNDVISLGTNDFDGYTLYFSYGYGLIEAAVYSASDRAWMIKTANYTAYSGDRILASTAAGSITITLPANPVVGAFVKIADYDSSFGTNALTIDRNNQLIAGATDNVTIDVSDYSVMMVYSGATRGWVYGI